MALLPQCLSSLETKWDHLLRWSRSPFLNGRPGPLRRAADSNTMGNRLHAAPRDILTLPVHFCLEGEIHPPSASFLASPLRSRGVELTTFAQGKWSNGVPCSPCMFLDGRWAQLTWERKSVSSVDQASVDASPATVHRGWLLRQTLGNHRHYQQCFPKTSREHTHGLMGKITRHVDKWPRKQSLTMGSFSSKSKLSSHWYSVSNYRVGKAQQRFIFTLETLKASSTNTWQLLSNNEKKIST